MKKLAWWRTQKDLMRQFREMGLTRSEIIALKKMDRDDVIKEFERIQEERRADLLASGVNVNTTVPIVGNEIRWSDVVQMAFRVLEFDRNDTVVDLDKGAKSIKAKSETEPYGYLLVESPTLNQPVRLPIIHNNDFWLASSVFDDPVLFGQLGKNAELLVTYAPKHMNKDGLATSAHHVLHYALAPRGTLERYYSDDSAGDKRMSRPESHLLFGPFVYDGEVKVGINQNPDV